ncbi:MAG: hypothetical protein CMF06_02255 [Hyphomonas sp.]|nr:hypothetical protein [Hyphomonas sp.]
MFSPSLTRFFISWFGLVPVVLKIADVLPERIEILSDPRVEFVLALPFSWKALWIASLLYAVAFIIYTFFCPKFIKMYGSYEEYASRGNSPRWLVWEFFYAWNSITEPQKEILWKRCSEKSFVIEVSNEAALSNKPEVVHSGTNYIFEWKSKKYQISVNESLCATKEKDLFWEIFGRWAGASRRLRHVAWILYYASILIAAGVVIQNVFFAASHLF